MIKINSLISKISLFFLTLLLILGCKEDEITIDFPVPSVVAPVPPERNTINVKSLYSNAYTNEIIDTWNAPRESSTTEEFFIQVEGDDVIRYSNLNFARVEFSTSPVDISNMSTLHIDIWTPDPISERSEFEVLLIDFGANGVFSGGDDSSHEITISSSSLSSENWISLEIPLSDFTGLSSTTNLAQMVLSATLSNLYIDNVYFYGEAEAPQPITPITAAPIPTQSASDVLSVFSDTYTNVANTNFDPDWGQSTDATQTTIVGNNTLSYATFNYQGVDIGGDGVSINASTYEFLHLDYYSSNASVLRVFLISNGTETPYTLTVPTSGWNSIDIALSAFTPVNLSAVIQLKFDGGDGASNVYLDNIYFHTIGSGNSDCPAPPAGDFIVDGGFETNAGCWELIVNQGNTSVTIVSDVNNGGTNSARIKTAPAGNPGIKQTRFGVGSILPNTVYVVKFDIRQDAADPVADGAVFKVAAFAEAAEGSSIGAIPYFLIPGDGSVPGTWTPRTLTFTTPANAANVAGGLSLLIELVGGGPPTTGTIYIDNVSLKVQ